MQTKIILTAALSVSIMLSTAYAYTSRQAEQGKEIYAQQCAKCHGSEGQGGQKAPPLIGEDKMPDQKTAGDAYRFVKEYMPRDQPGILSEDQSLAVVAFILQENGMEADGAPLTVESADQIDLRKK